MAGINVASGDKDRFDEIKNENETQAECFSRVLDGFENADEPVVIDTDKIVAEINARVASNCEVAAFRGTKEALESHE